MARTGFVLLRAVLIGAVLASIGLAPPALAATPGTVSATGVVGTAIAPVALIDGAALTAPVTWNVIPALPAGLSLDVSSGSAVLSGTPTVAVPTTVVTVSGTDTSAPPTTVAVDVSLTIDGTLTVPAVSAFVGRALPGTPTITTKGLAAPVAFTAPTAPAWLSISPDGVLLGTPDAELATTQIPVSATDATGAKATGSLTLTVTTALVPAEQTIEARVGSALQKPTMSFSAKPGHHFEISPSISTLTGLDFDSASGVVSGTPTRPLAPTAFMVNQIPDAGGPSIASAVITATVVGVMAPSTQTVLGNVGDPIIPFAGCGAAAAASAGLVGTVSFATEPALPGASVPGDLAIDSSTGVLAGQARKATAGTRYLVTATDASGATATCVLMIVVNGTLNPQTQLLNANTSTRTTSLPLIPVGLAEPITYAVSPPLPLGLTMDPGTGAVSGIVRTSRLTAVFTIVATDANGATAAAILTVSVGRVQLTPPVITAVLPGQQEGSLQVFFTPPAFAPGIQTYSVLVYSAKDLRLVGRKDVLKSPVIVGELEPGVTYQVVVVANATTFFDRVESTPKSGTAARFTAATTSTAVDASQPLAGTTVAQRPNLAALRRAGITLASANSQVTRIALRSQPVASLKSAPTLRIAKSRAVAISVPGVQSTQRLLISVKVDGAWLTLGTGQASKSLRLRLPALAISGSGGYPIRISGDYTRSLYFEVEVR